MAQAPVQGRVSLQGQALDEALGPQPATRHKLSMRSKTKGNSELQEFFILSIVRQSKKH
jgi:hypothetical protein